MKTINYIKLLFLSILLLTSASLYAADKSNGYVKDSAITAYVKGKIAMNKPLASFHVKVITNNGVVSLNGTVNSEAQASSLIELAASAPGVKDVNSSNLKVKQDNDQPFTDAAITAKVKGAFVREKLFSSSDVAVMTIHVETRDGVVYLTGDADNQAQADNALRIAQTIKGVKHVESLVKVAGGSL